MISAGAALGGGIAVHPLKDAFLRWQCRARQMMMREDDGRPGDAVMPEVFPPGAEAPMGRIITVLNKLPAHSVTTELLHMSRRTNDPAHRRGRALQFFAAGHYQKHREFSDLLTATFRAGSPGAARLREGRTCTLVFDAYSQRFSLWCRVWRLTERNPLHAATMAHNRLFNPQLPGDAVVLGFEPDWTRSSADPSPL